MSFTLRVHEYGKIPGSSMMKLVKATHYIRVAANGQPPIYIQSGKLWFEGGDPCVNPPDWFWESLEKIDPSQLESVKFDKEAFMSGKNEAKAEARAAKQALRESLKVEAKPKRPYKRKTETQQPVEAPDGND